MPDRTMQGPPDQPNMQSGPNPDFWGERTARLGPLAEVEKALSDAESAAAAYHEAQDEVRRRHDRSDLAD